MQLIEQLKKYFFELFDVAGFDKKTNDTMVGKVLRVWLTKSFTKIFELLKEEEKKQFTELLNNFTKNIDNEQSKKELFQFFSSFDKDRDEKILDIFYDEAADIIEIMIKKFNLKSTPQQQAEYIKRIAPLLNDIKK